VEVVDSGSGGANTVALVGNTLRFSVDVAAGFTAQQAVSMLAADATLAPQFTAQLDRSIDATNTGGGVSGTVPATLGLTLGTPAAFGAFTPGVDKDYVASSTANVVSTAGDATLSVADPSAVNTGKLMNGTFTLAQVLQASATSAGGTGSALAPVGGSANPTTLLTYNAPKSNDAVTINFKQSIGRTEGLRTGPYSKTLTFTLSTTTP